MVLPDNHRGKNRSLDCGRIDLRFAFQSAPCSNWPSNGARAAQNHLPDRNAMRLFTLEEANTLLPDVKRLIAEIDEARATLRRLAPEAKRASESQGGGGTMYGVQYADSLASFIASAQNILSLGVEI